MSKARMSLSKILPQTSKKFTQIYLPYLWHYATLTEPSFTGEPLVVKEAVRGWKDDNDYSNSWHRHQERHCLEAAPRKRYHITFHSHSHTSLFVTFINNNNNDKVLFRKRKLIWNERWPNCKTQPPASIAMQCIDWVTVSPMFVWLFVRQRQRFPFFSKSICWRTAFLLLVHGGDEWGR